MPEIEDTRTRGEGGIAECLKLGSPHSLEGFFNVFPAELLPTFKVLWLGCKIPDSTLSVQATVILLDTLGDKKILPISPLY